MDLTIAKRVLGFMSLGIGVAVVAFPEHVKRILGMDDAEPEALSAFGAREIAAGSGLLSPVKPGPWLWLRVGGDVMDLIALGKATKRENPQRNVVFGVMSLVAVIAVVDLAIAAHATFNPRENEEAAE